MIGVQNVYIRDWVVQGEFIEDTQYFDTIYFVMVDLEDGRTLCHNRSFANELHCASSLAQRVEAFGFINEDHWYEHEFFSLSLEERLSVDAVYEDAARNNVELPYSCWFSEGHA